MKANLKELITIAKSTGDWQSCLVSFSPKEQEILRAFGKDTLTTQQVALRVDITPNTCGTYLNTLANNEVLVNRVKTAKYARYRVADPGFAEYLAAHPLPPLTKVKAIAQTQALIRNAIAPMLLWMKQEGLVEDEEYLGEAIGGAVERTLRKEIKQ